MFDVIGHSQLEKDLSLQLKEGRLHQGLLFFGPSGIGKKQLAINLLSKYLCVASCGVCQSCLAVAEKQPDLIFTLELEEKKNITVAQVREIHRFFELKTEWPVRFVLIDDAHKLSAAAANALLKILEEPPENSHFFLLTDRIHSLPATIRSRCQLVRFSSLSNQDLAQIPGVTSDAIPWASGRVERALYLSSEEGQGHLNEALELFESLVRGISKKWKSDFPKMFSENSWSQSVFQILLRALQMRLRGESSRELLFLPTDDKSLLMAVRDIEKAQQDWARFLDKNLIIENLALSMHKIFKEKEDNLWKSPRIT